MEIRTSDLSKFNELLDELKKDSFFNHYKKLRAFYEYLAAAYQFDLETHSVDPDNGQIYRRTEQDFIFDNMTN